MSAPMIEKALTSTLGYLPEIETLTQDGDLIVGSGITPDEETLDDPGTQIGFVIDPTRRAMIIRIGDRDPHIVHPIDGPDQMTLRMAVRITDQLEWSDIRDHGEEQAIELLFGGQPEANGKLSFDSIEIKQLREMALIELQASSSDRAATARLAREMRRKDGWVPKSFRDAVFEIGVGSSTAPGPDSMGYEIVNMESWSVLLNDFPWARVALEIGKREDAKGRAMVDELVEGDIAVVHGSWDRTLPDIVSVDRQGTIRRISYDGLASHLPDTRGPSLGY